jgi:hypothetical protein
MEANEAKKYHVITGEPTAAAVAAHDIHVDGDGVNELDSNRERQELDVLERRCSRGVQNLMGQLDILR